MSVLSLSRSSGLFHGEQMVAVLSLWPSCPLPVTFTGLIWCSERSASQGQHHPAESCSEQSWQLELECDLECLGSLATVKNYPEEYLNISLNDCIKFHATDIPGSSSAN